MKPIITVWAEEKGLLGNGHYEFCSVMVVADLNTLTEVIV